jgi:hypothetical protein
MFLGKESPVEWGVTGTDEYLSGTRLIIKHAKVRTPFVCLLVCLIITYNSPKPTIK